MARTTVTTTLKRTTCISICIAALAGVACRVGPDYKAPAAPVAEHWVASSEVGSVTQIGLTPETPRELGHWWKQLDDQVLAALIEEALHANLDIAIADARLRETIALRRGAVANLYPALALDADYTHRRAARNASGGDNDGGFSGSVSQSVSSESGLGAPAANLRFGDTSATIRLPEPGSGETRPEISATQSRTFPNDDGFQRDRYAYSALLGATWEIDIWGNIRRGVEAADAEIGASLEDRRAVLVSVSAEVARNYVLLRGLQRLIEITKNNIAIQRETLSSIRARFAASLATGTDVLQAEIQLRRTESELPLLEAGVKEAIFRLSVLLGRPPGYLLDRLIAGAPLPVHPKIMPIGLPSDLLRRRPDVRAAERRLAAETARIGVEVAELFPRVSLVGTFGLQSAGAGDFVDPDSLSWSFGPAVRWRLLEFGRIVSNINVQREQQRQALALYYQSVLGAFEQVETSLANYAAQRRRAETLTQANIVNERAFELAKSEYAVGMISFLSVLDTQRSLFSTQTDLIRTQQLALAELVNVYESLGGGWSAGTAVSTDQEPS